MAENKTTTPKDNIKLLQSYKGEKFASLMQQILQEKNRALVLKSAIKAKIVQINEIEFEQERAKAQESEIAVPVVDDVKVEEKAEIIVEKAPVVEVKEEKQEVKEVTAEKAEEKAKTIVSEANQQATQLRTTVTKYCDNMLATTQEQLQKSFNEIKLVRDNLKK